MKDDKFYCIHILESINRIYGYMEGMSKNDFLSSTLTQDAVARNLQILAESTQRLSTTFKEQHPGIEWHGIAGLRNILVHDYLGIDFETVWSVVKNNLPELLNVIDSSNNKMTS